MVERAPGAVIREARERRQLTQAQLAKRLGVAERTVRMWETTSTVPRARRYALAAELELSESFTQPDTWGRSPDLTTSSGKSFVPPELRRMRRYASLEFSRADPSSPADTAEWAELASILLVMRGELDGVIRYVLQRVELGESGSKNDSHES